jgi:Family of unknown function (DUF6932)
MQLPGFNDAGDLPAGVHRVALDGVLQRFGAAVGQRGSCTRRLMHIYELARRTGHLERFIVFGSFVTAKAAPNDVDVVIIMDDMFRLEACPLETRGLFDHAVAQARFGASVFWARPSMLVAEESLEQFIGYWQVKRGGGKRGIVEIV